MNRENLDSSSNSLDDPLTLARLDRSGMRRLLMEFPEQVARGWELACEAPSFDQLVVCGMGGSAIGGDFLRIYLEAQGIPKPISVIRGCELPPWVDHQTLVFVVSYSGNTAETLACFEQALQRKCSLIVVTSGGELAHFAQKHGVPLIIVPQGLVPRAALGYLFLPLLKSLKRFVVGLPLEAEVDEAIQTLRTLASLYGETCETNNLAKHLARAWQGHFPIFYGSDRQTDVVAHRWVTQVNENAKVPASYNTLPELIHNEVMGWEQSPPHFSYTLLRDRDECPSIRQRFELCHRLLEERGQKVWEVQGTGEGFLARLLSLSYLGDWSSFYLAMLYGRDPTPVPLIEEIKAKLLKH